MAEAISENSGYKIAGEGTHTCFRLLSVIYTPWTSTASTNATAPNLPHNGPPHHHHSFTDLIEWSNPGEIDASLQPLNDLESFFEQNVDASGRTLPSNISFPGLAKRISPIGECMFFDYGVVVMWGLSEAEEEEILRELAGFEEEKLGRNPNRLLVPDVIGIH